MEETPRILEFTGEELHRVSHAYGTNGIITEIEIPLAPAYDWVQLFVTLNDFADAARFAYDLANEDGILIKLATVFEAPIAQDYFQRVSPYVKPGQAVLALMVAPHAMDAFATFTARRPGAQVIYRSDETHWDREPGPVFEYGWNHTTLRALKVDPAITYLQVGYGTDRPLELIEEIRRAFSPEVLQHLEASRMGGKTSSRASPLSASPPRSVWIEIVRLHEAAGAMVFNPHRYTLEEGGRQTVDDRQLRFKREADPEGAA